MGKHTGVWIMLGVFFLTIAPVYATNSWFEKGSETLKTFGLTKDTAAKNASAAGLSVDEIAAGLKEALQIGSDTVVKQLGATNGFNTDPAIHIPLPKSLSMVKTALDKIGYAALADDLELKLNRAAEAATPQAKKLFQDAISSMTFEDVQAIYKGADDAATQYFKEKMSPGLAKAMEPVIDNTLSQVGAVQSYDAMMGEYKALPFVPDVKSNLTGHVVDKGMAGIFHYMAQEEKAIRQNPAKRTTQLLQKVFN
ncbi:MAG: DUF4197 domain-containing protein [Proteobacteria bacterium]|nr:DUF4197 domain-containing protein [Desulfobacula sp.]MBU4130635.1 DUF4197 domain-containing protein [Pseudomonadota bacterium]